MFLGMRNDDDIKMEMKNKRRPFFSPPQLSANKQTKPTNKIVLWSKGVGKKGTIGRPECDSDSSRRSTIVITKKLQYMLIS